MHIYLWNQYKSKSSLQRKFKKIQRRNRNFKNKCAFRLPLRSYSSSQIDSSCLFKLQKDFCLSIKRFSAHKFLSDSRVFLSLLLHLTQSSSIKTIWCFLLGRPSPARRLHRCCHHRVLRHTYLPFLSVSLQIRAAEVCCYFIQDRLATEDGFLWTGPCYELETQGYFFSDWVFQHII